MLKKVLIFYPSFESGGATKNLIKIINYLLQKKVKVILFSHKAKKNKFKFSKNLYVIDNKPLKKFSILPIRWNLALSAMFSVYKYAKLKTDNSIIFSMQSHIPAIIISKILNKKVIIRNSEEPIGATIYADNKFLGLLVLFLKFIFYNFADKIIAISKKSENSLNKIFFFKKKIVLIFNPYIEKISKIKKIKSKRFRILSVGRFTYQKNIISLIDAFSNLSRKYKSIELIIIGKGSQKKLLVDKIKYLKNIKIVHWKKNIKSSYLSSDLFILNSFYEGLPNVLIEAVNYETPCISTDVSGANDILINGKGGYIIPINNQQKLEKKIEYVIQNYSEAKKKAKNAKNKIKRFSKINLPIFYKSLLKLENSVK